MDWEFFGVMMTLAGSGVGVMVGLAVAYRIANASKRNELEAGDGADPEAHERLLASLSTVEKRMASLEERFEFNERLLQGRTADQTPPPKVDSGE